MNASPNKTESWQLADALPTAVGVRVASASCPSFPSSLWLVFY